MSQRSTVQHCFIDTPFCTIRKSHVTWNFAVPVPHSEEIRRCILLFLCALGIMKDRDESATPSPINLWLNILSHGSPTICMSRTFLSCSMRMDMFGRSSGVSAQHIIIISYLEVESQTDQMGYNIFRDFMHNCVLVNSNPRDGLFLHWPSLTYVSPSWLWMHCVAHVFRIQANPSDWQDTCTVIGSIWGTLRNEACRPDGHWFIGVLETWGDAIAI